MKRRRYTGRLLAILAAGVLMLSACSEGSEGLSAAESGNYAQSDSRAGSVFTGEWTVDKQVVDTARLEVAEALRVRLPEAYLVSLCFGSVTDNASEAAAIASEAAAIEPLGIAATIEIRDQGYTNGAVFSGFVPSAEKSGGVTLYRTANFVVSVNGDRYLVELLSTENGTAVYRADTMGWTIVIPIGRFRITHVLTREVREQRLGKPVTLYYNTKERTR